MIRVAVLWWTCSQFAPINLVCKREYVLHWIGQPGLLRYVLVLYFVALPFNSDKSNCLIEVGSARCSFQNHAHFVQGCGNPEHSGNGDYKRLVKCDQTKTCIVDYLHFGYMTYQKQKQKKRTESGIKTNWDFSLQFSKDRASWKKATIALCNEFASSFCLVKNTKAHTIWLQNCTI